LLLDNVSLTLIYRQSPSLIDRLIPALSSLIDQQIAALPCLIDRLNAALPSLIDRLIAALPCLLDQPTAASCLSVLGWSAYLQQAWISSS